MSGGTLREFRRRIASVKSTEKVTSVMKVIAASKLKTLHRKAIVSERYFSGLENMLARVASSVEGKVNSPFFKTNLLENERRLLLIAFSADRGLCGGFRSDMISMMKDRKIDMEKEGFSVKVLPVGRTACEKARKLFTPEFIDSRFGDLRTDSFIDNIEDISCEIMRMFSCGEINCCEVAYCRFESVSKQKNVVKRLLPFRLMDFLDIPDDEKPLNGSSMFRLIEPSPDLLLDIGAELLVNAFLRCAAINSEVSENCARMKAMDGATRNAKKAVEDLSLIYNRKRQASITTDLIEVISGAESMTVSD